MLGSQSWLHTRMIQGVLEITMLKPTLYSRPVASGPLGDFPTPCATPHRWSAPQEHLGQEGLFTQGSLHTQYTQWLTSTGLWMEESVI